MLLKKTHVKTSNKNGLDFFTLINSLNTKKTLLLDYLHLSKE